VQLRRPTHPHICGRSRRGRFLLFRRTRSDRKRAKVREVKEELRRRMHDPIPSQGQWLRQVVTGFFAYHVVPNNFDALAAFRYHIMVLWMRTLTRRSQKDRTGGTGSTGSRTSGCQSHASSTPGQTSASPSNIRGGSRMRECRTSGSVRGVPSNGHPYRNHGNACMPVALVFARSRCHLRQRTTSPT
jgi:hypothetical protein